MNGISLVKNRSSKMVERALTHALFVHCRCHVLQLASVHAANATPHHPDNVMEVLSLPPKMCRVIKGDSEGARSSRAQDCETVRHTLSCT